MERQVQQGFCWWDAKCQRLAPYAAFSSVIVGTKIVASIGTTFPFPIRLTDLHPASAFGSSSSALCTRASSNRSITCAREAVASSPSRAAALLVMHLDRASIEPRTAAAAANSSSAKFSGQPFSTNTCG